MIADAVSEFPAAAQLKIKKTATREFAAPGVKNGNDDLI